MPYPTQVTSERILERAQALIEAHGAEQMSLHQLAAALGIKTPSLYRYYGNKSELLRAVNLNTAARLIAAMRDAGSSAESDVERVVKMGLGYRTFAHANPHTYALAFSSTDAALRPDEVLLAGLAEQIQTVIAPLTNVVDSLTALRGLWALVHGFVSLELSAQLQRGGDLGEAFEAAVRTYVRGLS